MSASQRIADRFIISNPEQDLLGRGSMGDVYRAIDTHTGEPVAVKALDPRVVARDPGILERFAREGEALRQLNHPNIVRMVAAVEDEGRHYLVMEYVAGGSLQDLLEATRPDRANQSSFPTLSGLSIARVLEIALELADALTRAHHLGILHRDLKPANVLLAEDGTPRLTDFGIARVADSPRLTQTGVLVGTPDFLSPEACKGKLTDERGDIWAFGVLLFEMLTGETPFTGDTLSAKLSAILTQPVPNLGERCPDAPEALVDLVYRMLEKDCQQRIPSVRLVGAELEAILKGREVPAPLRLAPGESRFATPTPDTTQRRHNLPAQPTLFVGREAELAELARLLADPGVRLLTILGAGGIGKTRLALETGAAELDNFEHGVYFVPLAPLESAEAIVPTLAEALGFAFYEGREPRQQLLDYLREKNKLLIMDNFEHLLAGPEPGRGDGVSLVTDVLQTAPDVKVLCTSRARLNVQGEHLFRLAGMDFPDWETPEDAADLEGRAEYSAVKLFLQSARRVEPGFELAADNLKYVARICRLVQGMPLCILLAAAWLTMLTPAEVAAEIEASLDFLEADLRDVPERQRSMRAVFDHSWKLLTEREQEVFQDLAVFRGGFTWEAAQQVAGASLRELRSLVDWSLLQRDPAGRYGIHELLRQYAAEKLGQMPGKEEAAQDRHSTYYADLLQGKEADLTGRGQKQALAEIGAEIENVRAAWSWAVARSKIDEIDRSLESLAEFYRARAWFQEGEETFATAAQRLADVQEEIGDHRSRMVLGKVLLQQGRFCHSLGLVEKASELTQRSLAFFRDLGARREMAYALCYLGDLVAQRGGEGKPLHQEALAISREIGDRRGIALSLRGLGWDATEKGDYGAAKQLFQESLALFRNLGNQEGIAQSLDALGYTAWLLGEYGEAEHLFRDCLARSREVGDQRGIASALQGLAMAGAGLKEYSQVKLMSQESLAIFKEIGDLLEVEIVLGNLAEYANVQGEYAEAIQLAQEGLTISRKIDEPSGIAWALRALGDAVCGLGDLPKARRYHHQALEVITGIAQTFYTPRFLVGIAALLAAEGEKERALELLALFVHHPTSWHWMKHHRAAPLVAALEAELPADVVAAAWERGRARDLDATVAELLVELGGTGTDSLDPSEPSPEGNS